MKSTVPAKPTDKPDYTADPEARYAWHRLEAERLCGEQVNAARLADLLAAFALDHRHRPLSTVTAAEFAAWYSSKQQDPG